MLKGLSEDKDSHAADDSMESKYVGFFFSLQASGRKRAYTKC